ncbi:MAG: D-alanyl-D-alanine carboxypeptidase [Proteobacteria bacterium]|nr:D-alanyl-D-alanine carboxypeptidase [Pseudomonadota bacterium]
MRTLLCFLLSFLLAAPAWAIETAAKQAFLIDAGTQAVLMNKEGDAQMHPSSMTKMMTIYILFSRMKEGRVKLDSKFAVSEKAWRMQGSKTFVGLGSEIAVADLIPGIVIQSGNDACIVVAEGISGSEEAFVQEMNDTAQKIGMTGTHFVNSHGMPEDTHMTTARDLATLAQHLIHDFPEYYHYFSQPEYTYNNIRQYNRNRLLGTLGVDGLKTGHTEAGGYGITLSAQQDDRRLVLVINGMANEKERAEEGDKLLRWGFREFVNKTLVRQGQSVAEADVWYGKQATVPLVASHDLVVTMPAGSAANVSFTLKYNGPLPAPVAQGAHVADLVISAPGTEPQVVPLHAAQDVPALSGIGRMLANLRYYIQGKPQ